MLQQSSFLYLYPTASPVESRPLLHLQKVDPHLQRVDPVGVSLQGVQTGLRLRVPYLHHVVVGAAHHPSPVVLHAAHRRHMAHEHVQALPRLHVPHTQRGVSRSTHHPGARQNQTSITPTDMSDKNDMCNAASSEPLTTLGSDKPPSQLLTCFTYCFVVV